MKYQDYYKVLGVSREANRDEIKRAYRKLARKYHPDVSKESDAESRFKALTEAYEVLKDPEKRAAYDQLGQNWKAGEQFKAPPDWDANFEFNGAGFGSNDSAFSDFFENLFGQTSGGFRSGARGDFAQASLDHHAKIMIDMEDAFSGATRKITLQRPQLDQNGRMQSVPHTLEVKIPKGVLPGQQIRLRGQGAQGAQNRRGDLYLEIAFNAHTNYRIHGRDLEMDLPVTPWEAALGAEVEVPTPSGNVSLRVPANTRSRTKMRLKGRGFPGKSPSQSGDLFVLVDIVLPTANTDKSKALYEQMRRELFFNPRQHLAGKS